MSPRSERLRADADIALCDELLLLPEVLDAVEKERLLGLERLVDVDDCDAASSSSFDARLERRCERMDDVDDESKGGTPAVGS